MAKSYVALLALLLLATTTFAAQDAQEKTDAVNSAVKDIAGAQPSGYDNFIGSDGNEYVVVSVDETPSFLVQIIPQQGTYRAQVILQNSSIDDIVGSRYLRLAIQGKSPAEIEAQVHAQIMQFNSSRMMYESKYNTLFGIENSSCSGRDDCKKFCIATQACNYAYEKNGDAILDGISAYSDSKKEIDRLVLLGAQNVSGKSDLEVLTIYSDIIDSLKRSAQTMNGLEVQTPEYSLYSGQIEYDDQALEDANQMVLESTAPARIEDERKKTLESVKTITSIRASSILAQKEEQLKQEQMAQANTTTASQTNANQSSLDGIIVPQNTSLIETSPPIGAVKETTNQDSGFDGIIFNVAVVIVLVAAIEIALAIRRWYLKRRKDIEKNTNGLYKYIKEKKMSVGKKKEIYSLEDLL
ncbi:MAG: hypothetical protein WC492_00680 [Candidatus Micrarchaeia archaeon]